METLDVIEKMKEYDEASIWRDEDPSLSGAEWTFYALNDHGGLDIDDWQGNGNTIVEAYKDAVESENG